MKPRLRLSLLGPFQVQLEGQKVVGFKSNKVRALLAYLCVEADRPHQREALAGLLWPDWPDREALSNLRYALSNLRQVIADEGAEPPFLLISRESLQFNPESDHWLDVAAFARQARVDRADPAAQEQLQGAVELVQGEFLEGFSVEDSSSYEEWLRYRREDVVRQLASALHWLAESYEQRGEYEQAQAYAWRQLEQEPWDEAAHQLLMRTLAQSGQRNAALAQYQSCRRVLREELEVEPSEATTRLYEQIRDGKLGAPQAAPAARPGAAARLPGYLAKELPAAETPVFVARERELGKLNGMLELALAGQGRAAFVTGEAGSGKTALVGEFARRAQERHAELVVASGDCNAYTGIGDPYLPFREILELLTGDVGARLAAGAITQESARRLWRLIPGAVRALLEFGPDLVDTLVRREPLLERAGAYAQGAGIADWLNRLDEFTGRRPVLAPGPYSPQQINLFDQYTRVLQALAQNGPMLLILDDLQWADPGSISLLFHLGRRLAGSRILLVGAYRPEEIAYGREGGRHPLETVVNELRREYGDIQVDLEQAENWDFVEAFLDSEPNRLGTAFREMLFRQTHGLPLFTIELLRGMQERSDLVKDAEGRWSEGPNLNWESMPERVEAVVAERIGRLAPRLQSALRAACVEGEVFIAEVIARVQAVDEREMLGSLSGELDRTHRLIQAQSIVRVDGQRLSRYRFQHFLFQKYLYGSLDEVERVSLHEQIGLALEGLYAAQGESAAVMDIGLQLARHFQEAGITEKAIDYLHQAGDRAVRLSAYQQGIKHLTRALDLLITLPVSTKRDQKELALQISLGIAWKWNIMSPEWENTVNRARELCHRTGKTTELWWVISELSMFYYVRAEHRKARQLGE
jgi:DNA-binding SARP family transcriptional activator